jgi:protein-tyrosine phosphatase
VTGGEAVASRILAWEGLLNARDLGGLPTSDGARIRWGALVRSDMLPRLTEAGQAALIEHGIGTVIDVRFPDEVAQNWDAYPFRVASPDARAPRYVNVPFDTGRDLGREHVRAAYQQAENREAINRVDIDLNQRGIAAIVTAVAHAPDGGVLVHCHAGKDRTGAVVAILLALAGVPDDVIADDYALSAVNLAPMIAEWLDSMSDEPAERARLTRLSNPSREAMLDTLAYVRHRHGGPEAYLLAGGVTPADLQRVRTRLRDDRG